MNNTPTRQALSKKIRQGLGALTVWVIYALLTPGLEACPKCMGATPPQSFTAYLLTALLLSVLPLGMFATLVYTVRKQLKVPSSSPDRPANKTPGPPPE